MIVEQTVLAAAQFTGLAGAGLVTFTDIPLPAGPDATIFVQTIALETEEQIPTIFCRFLHPAASSLTSLRRVTVLRPLDSSGSPVATQGFSKYGCEITVPKDIATNRSYLLVLTTVGKTLDAVFTVEYGLGYRPGAIPNR